MELEESPGTNICSRRVNIHSRRRQIFGLRLGGKGIAGVGHLQYLTGCLRAADNQLCGKTIAWKEGRVERRG